MTAPPTPDTSSDDAATRAAIRAVVDANDELTAARDVVDDRQRDLAAALQSGVDSGVRMADLADAIGLSRGGAYKVIERAAKDGR